MNGVLYPLFLIFYFLRIWFSLITIIVSLMDKSIGRPRQRQTMFDMFETDTDRWKRSFDVERPSKISCVRREVREGPVKLAGYLVEIVWGLSEASGKNLSSSEVLSRREAPPNGGASDKVHGFSSVLRLHYPVCPQVKEWCVCYLLLWLTTIQSLLADTNWCFQASLYDLYLDVNGSIYNVYLLRKFNSREIKCPIDSYLVKQ